MLELNNALELIIKGIGDKTTELGFRPEYPNGIFPPNLPVEEVNGKSVIMYRGENGRIRIEYDNGKLGLFCAKQTNLTLDLWALSLFFQIIFRFS